MVSENVYFHKQVAIGSDDTRRLYPHKTGGAKIWRDNLVAMFPHEEFAIDKYMEVSKKVSLTRDQTIR